MVTVVRFVLDEGGALGELRDVTVPYVGAEVEYDGTLYRAVHLRFSYWTSDAPVVVTVTLIHCSSASASNSHPRTWGDPSPSSS
ncbi:hypothetical protein ACSMXN_17435 [Jatrophihabitans sp. DSM 45814]